MANLKRSKIALKKRALEKLTQNTLVLLFDMRWTFEMVKRKALSGLPRRPTDKANSSVMKRYWCRSEWVELFGADVGQRLECSGAMFVQKLLGLSSCVVILLYIG